MEDKYFELDNQAGQKHKEVNMGTILINFMEQDSDNKIDSQTLLGIDNTRNKQLKDLVRRSDFITLRSKASRPICLRGETVMGLMIYKGKEYIKMFEIETYTREFNEFTDLTVSVDVKNGKNGMSKEIKLYRWYIKEGRIFRDTIKRKGNIDEVTTTFPYPTKYKTIPFTLIRNNPISEPDYMKAVTIFQEINALSNDIGEEWEMTKTIWQSNSWAGNGGGANFVEELKNGKRQIDTFNPNSKIAQQFGAIMQGSITSSQLIHNIVFLEDRAMKYSFSGRDMDNSGTNKHNAQVGLFNQAHSEYLQKKSRQRERDYLTFFKDVVARYVQGVKIPNKITFDMSEFEKGKVEGMRAAQANRELIEAQKKVQLNAAEKSQATATKEAELAKKAAAEAKVIEENNATTVAKSNEESTRINKESQK